MADNNQDKPTLSWSQPAQHKPVVNTNQAPTIASATPAVSAKTNTPVAASTSNTGTYVGIFVAGLIIGALIGWGITSSGTNNTSTVATSTAMTATSTSATGTTVDVNGSTIGSTNNTSVTLAPTEPAGFAVMVTNMTVSQPTWLVVYEDHNGTAGNAIGAGLFFPGQNSGTVQLLRATLPGQSYLVGQAIDNGDKTFSLADDKQVQSADGTPLYTEFTAK
jgi:hypothetical protein